MPQQPFAGVPIQTVAATGAAVTLDLAQGSMFDITLTAASVAVTLPPVAGNAGKRILVVVRQDASGARVATWPGGIVKWPAGATPTITVAANAIDLIDFTCIDGAFWLGQARQAYA